MQTVRIAAVMMQAPVGRTEENLAAVAGWTQRARQAGAHLVCFPEMTLTGYSIRKSLARWAMTVDGPVADALARMADREGLTLLVGTVEPGPDDRLYAAHWVVRPGTPIAVYRKTHIAPPERSLLAPGGSVPVFRGERFRFGIQLCYDAHFPELAAHMACRGADVIFCPHASPRGTPQEKIASWLRHLTARAFDNGVFVVACNQAGDNGEGLSFPAAAVALGPSGQILDQDTAGGEGFLVVDLDPSLLDHVRGHRMRYFLPNRRPELYQRLLRRQSTPEAETDLS